MDNMQKILDVWQAQVRTDSTYIMLKVIFLARLYLFSSSLTLPLVDTFPYFVFVLPLPPSLPPSFPSSLSSLPSSLSSLLVLAPSTSTQHDYFFSHLILPFYLSLSHPLLSSLSILLSSLLSTLFSSLNISFSICSDYRLHHLKKN